MLKYILNRFCYVVILLFILSIFCFFILYSNSFFKTSPTNITTNEHLSNLGHAVRLEDVDDYYNEKEISVFIQYVRWIKRLFSNDFGYSFYYRQSVSELIRIPVLNTIRLTFFSLLLVTVISIPIGVIAAANRYREFDRIIGNISIIGISLPPFVLAILFIYIFSIRLKILPYKVFLAEAISNNSFMNIFNYLRCNIMPILVISAAPLSNIVRYIRVEMTGVLRKDYIRLAKAKGLKKIQIIYIHALKNIVDSIISMLTWGFSVILTTTVVVESIFSINGLGQLLLDALKLGDGLIILTVNIIYVVIAIVGNMCFNLINNISKDPRIRT